MYLGLVKAAALAAAGAAAAGVDFEVDAEEVAAGTLLFRLTLELDPEPPAPLEEAAL